MSSTDFSTPNFDFSQLPQIDFQNYLATDKTYQDALQAIQDQQTADQATLNAGIYQGLINFGEVPTDPVTGQPVSSVPTTVLDQIRQATDAGLSQTGQLARQYLLDQSTLQGRLGESGMIRSGEYEYGTNKDLRNQQLNRQNFLNSLMQSINTGQFNYTSQIQALLGQRSGITTDAFNRLMALINARAAALAAQPPPTPAATTTPAGQADPTGGGTTGPTSWPAADTPGAPTQPVQSSPVQPVTPYVEAGQVVEEPKLSEQQGYDAYGSGGVQQDTSPAVPDIPAPAAPVSTYLQTNSSDAGGRSVNYPINTPPPPVAAPKPAGYGGNATKYQVLRNR